MKRHKSVSKIGEGSKFMEVHLEAINFNHDHESVSTDAFNIRKNETTSIDLPEWRRGVSVNPEDSRAAYSICDTRDHLLTIKARFRCSDKAIKQLTIQAIEAADSCSTHSVLGKVSKTLVTFVDGVSEFTFFNLQDPKIWTLGIGVYDIAWSWQYFEDSSSSWVEFARSSHRIYTTLNLPQEPWNQQPFDSANTHLVWTDVLDRACNWARGVSQEADEASAAIVREVFALGPTLLEYDSRNSACPQYSDDLQFDCTAFLLRLSGKQSLGRFVSCSDCAAIVSTFANAVGSSLSQARMGPPHGKGFPLGPHIRIGLPDLSGGSFRYHEVGWKGNATKTEDVFDACLVIDGDNNPGTFTVRSASDLPFTEYRLRLVGKTYEHLCLPIENSARRRKLGPTPRGLRIRLPGNAPALAAAPPHRLIQDFNFKGNELIGFKLKGSRTLVDDSGVPVVQAFWVETEQESSLIRIDAYECSSVTEAREGVLTLLDEFQLPGIDEVSDWGSEVFSFANSEKVTALFAVANMVFLVRNIGEATSQVSPIVTNLRDLVGPSPIERNQGIVGSEAQTNTTFRSVANQSINLKGDNVMASIFDGDWHSYAEAPLRPFELDPDGTFHIEVDASGNLINSNHSGNPVRGHVIEAQKFIHIEENDLVLGTVTYEGTFVHEQFVKPTLRGWTCGKYILPSGFLARNRASQTLIQRLRENSQDEGTWVITKP